MQRLAQAAPGETVFVVSAEPAPAALLERVNDARNKATILALDLGDPELDQLAHEALSVPPGAAPLSFGAAQHLVSLAAGQQDEPGHGLRQWLNRVLDTVSGPAPGG